MDVVEKRIRGKMISDNLPKLNVSAYERRHFSDDELGKELTNPPLCEACEDYVDECICPEREVRELREMGEDV